MQKYRGVITAEELLLFTRSLSSSVPFVQNTGLPALVCNPISCLYSRWTDPNSRCENKSLIRTNLNQTARLSAQ